MRRPYSNRAIAGDHHTCAWHLTPLPSLPLTHDCSKIILISYLITTNLVYLVTPLHSQHTFVSFLLFLICFMAHYLVGAVVGLPLAAFLFLGALGPNPAAALLKVTYCLRTSWRSCKDGQ